MRKYLLLFCFIGITTTSFSRPTISIPKISLDPSKTVKDVLGEFENTGNRLIGNAQSAANSVAARFGNELSVAVQNLTYYFGEDIKATMGNLKVEERNLFGLLNNVIDKFNHFNQKIYRISELLNLDLIDFTNRLPLTRKVEYCISSVNGYTLVNADEADYKMTITGLGFGLSDGITKYDTKIYIDNVLLSTNNLDFTERRQITVSIPNNLVKSSFKDKAIVFLPVQIINQIKTPGNLLKSKKVKVYETTFKLTLLPVIAGKVTITEIINEKKATSTPVSHVWSRTFKDKECQTDKPCEINEPWTVPAQQKITNVVYSCDGMCQFSYPFNIAGQSKTFEISDNGNSVQLYRHIDGSNNTTIKFEIFYVSYEDSYRRIKNSTINLKYGVPINVSLNPLNSDGNFSIKGKLTTGQVIDYNQVTVSQSPYLKNLGTAKTGNFIETTFLVNPSY